MSGWKCIEKENLHVPRVIHVQFSLAFQILRNVRRWVLCAPLEQFAIAKRTLVIRAPVRSAMKKVIRQKETANA